MSEFLNAQQASERFDEVKQEIEEKVYEVSDMTRSILAGAIESAMREGKRDVSMTSQGYRIEEGGGLVKAFLQQQGYENVMVEERGYSCFDDNRGMTQILFSF